MADAKVVRIAGENRDLPGFLRLPYELRQRIYRECLLEPELWHRPHASTCRFAATDETSTERPAFTKTSLVESIEGDCTCTRRSGLVLLRLCRLIHREASDLFWANNTFCFTHPADLALNFFEHIRPSRRILIRHICVMPYAGDSIKGRQLNYTHRPPPPHPHHLNHVQYRGHTARLMAWIEAMWESILACQGLQTLELHDWLMVNQLEMHASRIRACLPRLQTFRLVSLLAYKVWPAQEEVDELAARRRTRNKLLLRRRNGAGSSSDSDSGDDEANPNGTDDDDDGLDTNIGLDVPVAVTTLGSTMPNYHTSHADAQPPPPPRVRRLALNPIIPGAVYNTVHDFSRMLWFKVGVTVDDATIDSFSRGTTTTTRLFPPPVDERTARRTEEHYNRDRELDSLVYRNASNSDSDSDSDSDVEEEPVVEGEDEGEEEEEPVVDPKVAQHDADVEAATSSYKEMLRNFRTNFLVHMRHAIQKDLPFAWGALQESERVPPPPLPLRKMDMLSPKQIKKDVRYRCADLIYVGVDHPRFSCQKYGSMRRFLRVGTARPENQLLYAMPQYDEHDWVPREHRGSSDPMEDEHGPMLYNQNYGLKRFHPGALLNVQKRIPRFLEERIDKTGAVLKPTLRDGKQHNVEVFGLPLTHEEHLRRMRERQYFAAKNITTPEMLATKKAKEREALSKCGFFFRPRIQKRSQDRRNYVAELRERAVRCSERKREAARAEKLARDKAAWERRRDAHAQKKQRQLERKRLPGVALLHAQQKRLLDKQRAQQQAEREELEAEAEKKMQMLQQLAQKRKKQRKQHKQQRGSCSDDDNFVACYSGTSSESESDDESDDEVKKKVEEETFDDDAQDETEEDDDDEERWPAPAKWTKPEKRAPRPERYGGYAYKKGNRKPARLFYATSNGLHLGDPDAFDVYD